VRLAVVIAVFSVQLRVIDVSYPSEVSNWFRYEVASFPEKAKSTDSVITAPCNGAIASVRTAMYAVIFMNTRQSAFNIEKANTER